MCQLSNTTGSNSDSETSGEDGDPIAAYSIKDFYQQLIEKANTVPITKVFKLYGVHIDEHNVKACCPFLFHKKGRENSPSFVYYAATNSFRCFGCNTGSPYAHAVEFVAAFEGISKVDAAHK